MRPHLKHNGSILIIVLIVFSLLSIIAVTTAGRMNLRKRQIQIILDEASSYHIAYGALQEVIMSLEEDRADNDYDHNQEPWRRAFFFKDGKSKTLDFRTTENQITGTYTVKITDELTKLNLNTADFNVLRALFERLSISGPEALARRIIAQKQRAIRFLTTYDVLDVESVVAEDVMGKDGWGQYVTAFGGGRININTASEEVLGAMPGMNEDIVQVFLDKQESGGFGSMGELKEIPLLSSKALEQIGLWASVKSNWHTVEITAQANISAKPYHIAAIIDRASRPAKILYFRGEAQ